MIKISQEDALRLIKEYGVKLGEDGIIAPHSHHKNHYYLTENEYNMRSLLKFSKNDVAKNILDNINERKRQYNKKKKDLDI